MDEIKRSSPTPEAIERNASLVRDYMSGDFSMVALVKKYEVSSSRIYQIIKRHNQKQAK